MAILGRVSVADVISFEPCDSDSARRIEELFDGRETINVFDILAMDMPFEHKMWLIIRPELIDQDTINLINQDALALMTDTSNEMYQKAMKSNPNFIIHKLVRYSGEEYSTISDDLTTKITNLVLNRIQ